MNSLIRRFVLPVCALAGSALLLILALVFITSSVTHADNNEPYRNGRLITIHDRGVEKVILSQAGTVGDALKDADIILSPKDTVEPSVDEKLIASEYQVNIYRARPVIVVDGDIRQKIITPYQTVEQIVADAGIVLYPEDETTLGLVNDLSEGAGLQLTIKRSTLISFNQYGKTGDVRTRGRTVGEMLIEKGINVSKDDRVLPDQSVQITAGMSVRIWREGKQTVTVEEQIDFETDKIENADLNVGYVEVRTAGEKGLRNVTYEVLIQDGKEVSRIEIVGVVTQQPKKQVEVIGVKGQYTTPSENENITWDFLISNGFSRVQAAGIMGNLMQEHHFNTTGDGLAQWTGSRRANLYSRPYPNNIYTQLNFLMEELNGGYAGVRDAMKASDSLVEVVQIFQNRFERCGYCMENNRISYARNILASH